MYTFRILKNIVYLDCFIKKSILIEYFKLYYIFANIPKKRISEWIGQLKNITIQSQRDPLSHKNQVIYISQEGEILLKACFCIWMGKALDLYYACEP
jgi:hypothetical protein